MSGGSKKDGGDSVTTVSEPWAPSQPYLKGGNGKVGIMPEAERLYRTAPDATPPFDPLQTQGQEMALNYAGNFGSMYSPLMNAAQFNLKDVLYPESNPALESYMQAATRPLEQQLSFGTLPGIRGDFIGTQGGGTSSRQGVAEGIARGLTNQAIGDTRAKIASAGYGQGLDQQARTMSLYPDLIKLGILPSDITAGVGGQRQQQQAALNQNPYQRLASYNSILNPLGALGKIGQDPRQVPQGSFLGDLGQGAAGLASLISAFGAFSDIRLKKNIVKLADGEISIYKWDWNEDAEKLGLKGSSIGVIADEVEKVRPELVGSMYGYKTVNYAGL